MKTELINIICATHVEQLYFKIINLTKDYFVTSLGRKLFLRFKELAEKQIRPDYSILTSQITPSEEKILQDILKEIDFNKWEDYFKILEEEKRNRVISDVAHKCLSNIPSKEKIELLSDTTLKLLGKENDHRVYTIGEVLKNISLDKLDVGISLGLDPIDELMGNLHKGDYFIIAGRPGMGKTAFLIDTHVKASYKRGWPTILFSAESEREQIASRFWANVAKVPYSAFRRNSFSVDQISRLKKVKQKVMDCPFNLCVLPEFTPITVDNFIRTKQQEYERIYFISIDYIQRMAGGEDTALVTKTSGELMNMALYHNIPFIVASQLRRPDPSEKTKRPTLEDLRQSGAIEQDATTVMFFWRKSYYDEIIKAQDIADGGDTKMELILEKNRFGETGTVEVRYNLINQKFNFK